jgi:GTPase SAR1 family protein
MDADEDSDCGYKVLVIGPYYAGKSCFIHRYVDGLYDSRELYKQTMGGR